METTLADRVRLERQRLGLTQFDLAVRSGISVAQIANIESGRTRDPRLSTVEAILAALEGNATNGGPA